MAQWVQRELAALELNDGAGTVLAHRERDLERLVEQRERRYCEQRGELIQQRAPALGHVQRDAWAVLIQAPQRLHRVPARPPGPLVQQRLAQRQQVVAVV